MKTVYVIMQCDATEPKEGAGVLAAVFADREAAEKSIESAGKVPGIRLEIRDMRLR